MKQLPNLLLALLIPTFLESINPKLYLFEIPGSPLSLGRLGLVALGSFAILTRGVKMSSAFTGFLLIYVGSVIGAFFSDDTLTNLSNAFAQILLLFGGLGLGILLKERHKNLFLVFDIFMAAMFLYWLQYTLTKTVLSGNFVSYTTLFLKSKATNHHIVGIGITHSGIYLVARLYDKGGKKVYGYIIAGISMLLCLLIESRSNLLIMGIGTLWLVQQERRKNLGYILVLVFSCYVIYELITYFLEGYAFLSKRFDIQDSKYQSETNQSRLYIYQQFLTEFFRYPLGRGTLNARIYVDFEYRAINLHNQFLTFMIAGGIIAAAGVYKVFVSLIKCLQFNKLEILQSQHISHTRAFTAMIVVFMLTLFTVESGGTLLFTGMGILMYLEMQYTAAKRIQENVKKQRRQSAKLRSTV